MADADQLDSGPVGPGWAVFGIIMPYMYPMLRLAAAAVVIGYASCVSKYVLDTAIPCSMNESAVSLLLFDFLEGVLGSLASVKRPCCRVIDRLTLGFPALFFSKRRLFSGLLTAVWSFFLVFSFLEPLFAPIGSEVAMVFLYLLGLFGAGVGMSLGVLLPTLFPGACFGAALVLLVGSFGTVMNPYYFPVIGGSVALVCALASA
jgi:hypothetical protein